MITHKSPISGIAAHAHWVATAGYDNQLILWDFNSHTAVARVYHDHLVNQVAFNNNGNLLLTSSSDHTARLWSVPDLKLKAVFSDHGDDVEMGVFHPFDHLVATASRDHVVRVFHFSGQLLHVFKGHTADVISVAWNHQGDEIFSSSDDGTVKRWSLLSGALIENIDFDGVETDTLAISALGTIYAGNDAGEIIVVNHGSQGNTQRYSAHEAGIKRLVLHEESGRLISISYDRKAYIWSTQHGVLSKLRSADLPAEIWARSCAFLNAKTAVFATFGASYAILDIEQSTWDLTKVGTTPGVNAVAVHSNHEWTVGDAGIVHKNGAAHKKLGSLCNFLTIVGEHLFTGGQMGALMHAVSGELVYQHHSPLNCGAAFIRDEKNYLVVGAYTGEGIVFSVEDNGAVKLEQILSLHRNAVKSIAVDDEQLFSVCADTAVSWFSLRDFSETGRINSAHERIANGCTSLGKGRFVSVGRDLKMRIWHEPTKFEVVDTPHERSIKCIASSSCGGRVATGSYSGTIAIYDVASKAWKEYVRPTMSGISSLYFDSAQNVFIASSYDGNVYRV
ncbi:MAG: WD40 repeat domain-containing protein [Pseudomonadota bacterium]